MLCDADNEPEAPVWVEVGAEVVLAVLIVPEDEEGVEVDDIATVELGFPVATAVWLPLQKILPPEMPLSWKHFERSATD